MKVMSKKLPPKKRFKYSLTERPQPKQNTPAKATRDDLLRLQAAKRNQITSDWFPTRCRVQFYAYDMELQRYHTAKGYSLTVIVASPEQMQALWAKLAETMKGTDWQVTS